MKFKTTITDSGARVWAEIEAADMEAAIDLMEKCMREGEQVTAGNPDCEPRTEWHFWLVGDYAVCVLRRPGAQDAAAWATATIKAREGAAE